MPDNRKFLRSKMREIRNCVDNKVEKDKLIFDKFFNTEEVKRAESFFIYASINSEVETDKIIKKLLFDGKKVCVPHTNNGIMSVKKLLTFPKELSIDRLGNICGVCDMELADFECECAVIPMLAFNDRLFRLGYGGGYYDRFLSSFNGFKLGLAYCEQFCNEFLENEFDVGLDAIITQKSIVRA